MVNDYDSNKIYDLKNVVKFVLLEQIHPINYDIVEIMGEFICSYPKYVKELLKVDHINYDNILECYNKKIKDNFMEDFNNLQTLVKNGKCKKVFYLKNLRITIYAFGILNVNSIKIYKNFKKTSSNFFDDTLYLDLEPIYGCNIIWRSFKNDKNNLSKFDMFDIKVEVLKDNLPPKIVFVGMFAKNKNDENNIFIFKSIFYHHKYYREIIFQNKKTKYIDIIKHFFPHNNLTLSPKIQENLNVNIKHPIVKYANESIFNFFKRILNLFKLAFIYRLEKINNGNNPESIGISIFTQFDDEQVFNTNPTSLDFRNGIIKGEIRDLFFDGEFIKINNLNKDTIYCILTTKTLINYTEVYNSIYVIEKNQIISFKGDNIDKTPLMGTVLKCEGTKVFLQMFTLKNDAEIKETLTDNDVIPLNINLNKTPILNNFNLSKIVGKDLQVKENENGKFEVFLNNNITYRNKSRFS